MNGISRKPAHTVTELASARQHQHQGKLAKTPIRPLLPQHRRRVARSGLAMDNPK